jgi:hypothetical protein
MSYDCSCDYDPPSFYRRETPKARKRYRCDECPGHVEVGETYERIVGMWEGYFSTFVTCERCVDLRTWVKNNVPCLCWAHGNGDDDMAAAIDEAYWRARDEVVGLRFGFLRRKIMRERHNQSHSERRAA